jgi:hypothetical protein
MSRRKQEQEETFETADGFQIEDLEGNPVEEKLEEEGDVAARDTFWDEEDDEEEKEEDDYFQSLAEQNDWEEGYDY